MALDKIVGWGLFLFFAVPLSLLIWAQFIRMIYETLRGK